MAQVVNMEQTPDKPQVKTTASLADLEASLKRARKVARACLIIQRVSLILAVAVVCGLSIGVLDYLVRTPWIMRAVLLALGVCFSTWAAVKFIVPAINFRPNLVEMALRLENTDKKGALGLKGNLASALELAKAPLLIGAGKEMVVRLVGELALKTRSMRVLGQLLAPRLTLERIGVAALAVLPLAVLALRAPELARIGVERVLMPWTSVQWPKRYAVADATLVKVHPTTAALALRAVLLKTPRDVGKSDVVVEYRAMSAESAGERWSGNWERVLLTGQGKLSTDMSQQLGGMQGELYERLLEPAAIDSRLALLTDEAVTLEYRISAGDDVTETRTILLARPPTIKSASVKIVAPDYATLDADFPFVIGMHELGMSDGSRGTVGPVLAGSHVELTLEFSKSMPLKASEAFARTLLGMSDEATTGIEPRERTWIVNWIARRPMTFAVSAADELGLALSDDTTFRFDTVQDTSPTAAMLNPASDESVLPTAVVSIKAEARDDVSLAAAAVEHQRHTGAKGTESRALEAAGEPVGFASADAVKIATSPRQTMIESVLDLGELDLRAGDELWVTATAQDAYGFEGSTHAMVRSAARKLRIITDSEFIEQIRSELSTVRQSAMRIDSDQSQTRNKTAEARGQQDAADAQRRQDAISDRLRPPAEALKRLQERFERNRATDASMDATLKDAQDALDQASKSSKDAAENLKQAAQSKEQNGGLSNDAKQRIDEAKGQQDQVRKELDRLMDMLGQSQDTWAARRQIEKLLAEQKKVTQESRGAGKETAGKSTQELSPKEAAELNRVAQEQRELSQRVQNAVDQMEAGAQANSKSNPSQSQAMKEAAQKGRQTQAADKQKKAAEQLERNQTQTANALQQQAEQALEEMLKSLEQSEKRRDEELRRILADVRESLERLIARQEAEIVSLAAGMREQKADGLDARMISLHETTLALKEEIAANREFAGVDVPVGDAAESQSDAIGALRESPAAFAKADAGERTSLQKLQEALKRIDELAKKSDEKDLARQRDELKKAYEELLARQVELRAGIEPLVAAAKTGKDLSRRERQLARDFAVTQEAVRTDVYTLREQSAFLEEAKVFEFAHDRLDAAAKAASEVLGAGNANAMLARSESTLVRTLESLVEALKDLKKKDDFRDGDSGGGGGGGGGGSGGEKEKTIPPIAELRLLRMMQQEAFETTKSAAEAGDRATVEAATLLQQQLSAQVRSLIERTKDQGGGPDLKTPMEIKPPTPDKPVKTEQGGAP